MYNSMREGGSEYNHDSDSKFNTTPNLSTVSCIFLSIFCFLSKGQVSNNASSNLQIISSQLIIVILSITSGEKGEVSSFSNKNFNVVTWKKILSYNFSIHPHGHV